MLGSPYEQFKARKRYLEGIASKTVVNLILYDNNFNEKEKMEILEIAKKIARKRGRVRVYLEDWSDAVFIYRREKLRKEGRK